MGKRSGQVLKILREQDNAPSVWWTDDGKRLGTFDGHNGAVWSCDITCAYTIWLSLRSRSSLLSSCAGESDRLITASADQSVRIWDMRTGKELFQVRVFTLHRKTGRVKPSQGGVCSWAGCGSV